MQRIADSVTVGDNTSSIQTSEDPMNLDRFALPVGAALAGIISFTMLGLMVNGFYTVVHAILGEPYVWGYWSMRCKRVDHPLLHGLLVGIAMMLGVVGYRMLSRSQSRVGLSRKIVVGLALLMLPLWEFVCLIGYVIFDITGSLITQFFPFAGGEAAWMSHRLTGSVYTLMVPIVIIFIVLLVKVTKGMLPEDSGWVRSTLTAAALGAIMVITGTVFWSMVTVRLLTAIAVGGV